MRSYTFCASLVSLLLASGSAWAIVVIDDMPPVGGSVQSSAPADDPGWANVGNRGVYIGGGVVLTAHHTGTTGAISFPSIPGSFDIVPGSACRVMNPASFGGETIDDAFTDLVTYKLATTPALPSLTLSTGTPSFGDTVTMIADGSGKGTALASWTDPGTSLAHSGFNAGSGGMKWGTNEVHEFMAGGGSTQYVLADSGSGDVISFATQFDERPAGFVGNYTEAQALGGDSGGAVFSKVGGGWELTGVIHAIERYDVTQPNAALYGNRTYAADISAYSDEVARCSAVSASVAAVPEPGGFAALLAVVTLICGAKWLERRWWSTHSIPACARLGGAVSRQLRQGNGRFVR